MKYLPWLAALLAGVLVYARLYAGFESWMFAAVGFPIGDERPGVVTDLTVGREAGIPVLALSDDVVGRLWQEAAACPAFLSHASPDLPFQKRSVQLNGVTGPACWHNVLDGVIATARQRDQMVLSEKVIAAAVSAATVKTLQDRDPFFVGQRNRAAIYSQGIPSDVPSPGLAIAVLVVRHTFTIARLADFLRFTGTLPTGLTPPSSKIVWSEFLDRKVLAAVTAKYGFHEGEER